MPCSEHSRRTWRAGGRALAALALALAAGLAAAHKASDSYLQIAAAPGRIDVRWDISER